MKVRNSFVTNSSSSSFIVAIKNNAKKSDIVKDLIECYSKKKLDFDLNIEAIIEYLGETDLKYLSTDEIELYNAYQSKDETFINKLFYMIADYLCDCIQDNQLLDSWNVNTIECSNEDDEFLSNLLFATGHFIKGEIIKLL